VTHKIAEIKDLDPAIQAKMSKHGITTVEHVLEATSTPNQRVTLARELGVSGSQLTEWINRADLMRLDGVGTEMANLLEECGVDSCRELQHRVPANLYTKLKAVNDEKKITHHAPSQVQVEAWIAEAATFAGQ
jgi:predicted flap endonuclease-1-like 5' DNA nuclease